MSLITIIGRGHSGTRAISHTLSASGVFMGSNLNVSGDLVPGDPMYEACRVLARHIRWKGGLEWDFSGVLEADPDPEFIALVEKYLESVLGSAAEHRGWKLPETTLAFPWILKLFPDAKYIYWVRNPCDCILGRHLTDDLKDFGIEYPATEDLRLRRAMSWKYQYDIVKAVPRPKNAILVRFEDFVLKQEETLGRLEDFLGFPLARIEVRPDTIDRWKTDDGVHYFDFLEPTMREYHYPIPESAATKPGLSISPRCAT